MTKIVFFKEMLSRADLSVGARVLWSWLVSEAIMSAGSADKLVGWLEDRGELVRTRGVGFASMPPEVGVSRATFHRKMSELSDAGIYKDGVLSCPVSVVQGGFFELLQDDRLASVEERVMYSWLYDRALWLNASIIFVSNPYMAKVLGMSVAMVRTHKTRMYGCGLLEVYHPRRGAYYTGIPALYRKLGRTVREKEKVVKSVEVIFE